MYKLLNGNCGLSTSVCICISLLLVLLVLLLLLLLLLFVELVKFVIELLFELVVLLVFVVAEEGVEVEFKKYCLVESVRPAMSELKLIN